MNFRKTYKQGIALGISESGLRRWCEDIIKNGPDTKVGPAIAILEELRKVEELRKQEKSSDDRLQRAISQIKGRVIR